MITGILMSLNDHGWGNDPGSGNRGGSKNNNGGPPDLDELWRDFNRRLSGLLGRKRGGPASGGGGDDGNGGPKLPALTPGQFGGGLGLLVGLAVAVWFASGFYIVDASQRGLVLTLGKFSETTDPGLRWRLPWPIQTHEVVNLTGVRTIEIGYRRLRRRTTVASRKTLMLTDDENIRQRPVRRAVSAEEYRRTTSSRTAIPTMP